MTLVRVNDIEGIDVRNLVFNEGVFKSFKSLSAEDLSKVVTVLGTLNLHGLSYEHFRNRIEKLTGKHKKLYEVKVKSIAKKEWKFIVTPVKSDSNLHTFYSLSNSYVDI